MSLPTNEYVEHTDGGGLRLRGTRVSLDSVVYAYEDGSSAEEIVINFPSLSLEQVHGAVAYYLRNRLDVERYLGGQAKLWAQLEQSSRTANADLRARIAVRKADLARHGSAA